MAVSWGPGFSLIGQQGLQGVAGKDGSVTRFGVGTPDNTLGKDGDSFFAKDTGLYFVRTNGAYDAGTSLRGPMGITGVNGASFYSGDESPIDNGQPGNNGDLYLNLSNGEIFRYDGVWSDTGHSIQGPAGARGSMTFVGSAAPTTSNPAGAQTGDVYYQTSSDGSVLKIYFLQPA